MIDMKKYVMSLLHPYNTKTSGGVEGGVEVGRTHNWVKLNLWELRIPPVMKLSRYSELQLLVDK